MVKAVLLLGGPSKGTRFRPLSMDAPKPLFPLAGMPLLEHHIRAAVRCLGEQLSEVVLLGFFQERSLKSFMNAAARTYKVSIRYLQEESMSGTAGGLCQFRSELLGEADEAEAESGPIIVMHADVLCAFPLQQLLQHHREHGQLATVMVTEVPKEHATQYGAVVVDEQSGAVLHYAEKPEAFVSNTINTGIYCLSVEFWDKMEDLKKAKTVELPPPPKSVLGKSSASFAVRNEHFMRLEQDVLFPLSGTGALMAFRYDGFWRSVKSAGSALYANAELINYYAETQDELLEVPRHVKCRLLGHNVIHPTARIHPSACVGPNASIEANVVVEAGARVRDCIVQEGSEVHSHALLNKCVLGSNSKVGAWARVEGKWNPGPFAYVDETKKTREGICIVGSEVQVAPEVLLFNCIIMPFKFIEKSKRNKILL